MISMIKGNLFLLLFFLMSLLAFAQPEEQDSLQKKTVVREAPDLDNLLRLAKDKYPHVDTLDRISYRLGYFDQHSPSQDRQQKIIEIYRTIANGYSINFHFKQGYIAYQKYLSLKERK